MTDNTTQVNSQEELERLVDGAVVLVEVRSQESGDNSPTTPMLHEKIRRKMFFGTRPGHRFIEAIDVAGASHDKVVVRYDIYGDKGISFNEGAIFLEKERVNIGFILPGQLQYQQTESQLRQAGLYHG